MRTLTTAVLVAFAGLAFGQETNTAALPSLDELLPSTEGDASLFASWPSAHDVADAAEQALPKIVHKAQFWRSRQKLAALLPRIRVGAKTQEANYDRYEWHRDPYHRNYLDDYSLTDGKRDYEGEFVWAEWDLSNLVFHNDELEVADLERKMTMLRKQVRSEAINIYFLLRETRLKLARNLAVKEDDRIKREMSAEKYTALLDDYTNGFFTRACCPRQPHEKSDTP